MTSDCTFLDNGVIVLGPGLRVKSSLATEWTVLRYGVHILQLGVQMQLGFAAVVC